MMKPAVIDLGPWMFRAICLLIAVIGMLILVRATGERMRLPPRALVGPLILASAINVTLWHVLTGFGLAYMAAGRAGIIAYLMPVISTVWRRRCWGEADLAEDRRPLPGCGGPGGADLARDRADRRRPARAAADAGLGLCLGLRHHADQRPPLGLFAGTVDHLADADRHAALVILALLLAPCPTRPR